MIQLSWALTINVRSPLLNLKAKKKSLHNVKVLDSNEEQFIFVHT